MPEIVMPTLDAIRADLRDRYPDYSWWQILSLVMQGVSFGGPPLPGFQSWSVPLPTDEELRAETTRRGLWEKRC